MAVDRPTFSETWYRVTDLRVRLRSTVQVHRQHFRGQMWQVLQDPSSNQFFRINESAYGFVGLLDGRRTVGEVWDICAEQYGDNAPTQGETIQLLGQLFTSNLIQGEISPDAESVFGRFNKRRVREVRGTMMNLMFVHIPLFDPDRILNAWVKVVGKVFSLWGLVLWAILLGFGFSAVVGQWGALASKASSVLDPANLPLLYVGIVLTKVVHEFGHAFACKRFGQIDGGGGEVHTMGVMLLVFTPLPYVDASSSWAFRSKWHRVIVASAGMMCELAMAAIAALIWARTAPGTPLHALCYNMMFIASVSTLLFNANPLLRYDGYYILSDTLEIPNLSTRGKQYIYYLIRKYVWGVRNPQSPAHSNGERAWFVFYGIASTIYRVFICAFILIRVADKFFIVGATLACVAVVGWVFVPIGKFIKYLATSGELARVRGRAVGSVLLTVALFIGGVGLIRVPDRARVSGIVDVAAGDYPYIYAEVDGFVQTVALKGARVTPEGDALVVMTNPAMDMRRVELVAQKKAETIQGRQARIEEPVMADAYASKLEATQYLLDEANRDVARLHVQSPITGVWLPEPTMDRRVGQYAQRGERLGRVVNTERVLVRALVDQDEAMLLASAATDARVSIRVRSRPDHVMTGRVVGLIPIGQDRLPNESLSFAAGGGLATETDDTTGRKSARQFFEVIVVPDTLPSAPLLGQRVILRFDMPSKPLAVQWWRKLLQMVQQRFNL
jgi:putative peptide zinc metalloprotease protein